MSKLIFNGHTHQISLIGDNGKAKGTWAAYNNVDSHASLTHVPNQRYAVQDRTRPHRHLASANGPYGLYGEAMKVIAASMAVEPLMEIDAINKHASMARSASKRNLHRNLHGRHHA